MLKGSSGVGGRGKGGRGGCPLRGGARELMTAAFKSFPGVLPYL